MAWLDLLLDLAMLSPYGFRFRQEYHYAPGTHRVVAKNRLATQNTVGRPLATRQGAAAGSAFAVRMLLADAAERHAGFLFLPFASDNDDAEAAAQYLRQELGVATRRLEAGGALLRTHSRADAERLLDALRPELESMPGVWQRFHPDTPEVTVSKEVVFDSAHFLTDHPAKCSNLHGGRYVLHVKVRGQIDPLTGCVLDYGYLKRVVRTRAWSNASTTTP